MSNRLDEIKKYQSIKEVILKKEPDEDVHWLISRVDKLEETLSFYANEKNYDSRHGMAILKDCGDKAREGLK